jgi:hypothetical protein
MPKFRESGYFPCLFVVSLFDKSWSCQPVSWKTFTLGCHRKCRKLFVKFHGYLVKGGTDAAAHSVSSRISQDCSEVGSLTWPADELHHKGQFFLAVADVLNTQAYLYKTCDELFLKVSVIVTKFKSLLIANDCLCHASAYACLASELRYETSVRSAKYSARNAA